jgi:AbrB family looped-hinge helix DNA binding protein
MHRTVTIKGQVTIPKAMRDYLHLDPGDKVVFSYLDSGAVRIEPARRRRGAKTRSRFARLRGRAVKGAHTAELMRLLRGYAGDSKDPGFGR